MVNVMVQVSKYILIVLSALYAIKCFTVFSDKHEMDRGSVYQDQVTLMFLIHFLCYLMIFLNTKETKMILFYLAQVVLFIVTLFVYATVYRSASRLIINNMCFLLMVGFVILTRLDFDLAIKQFAIAVVAIVISLVVPIFMAKVRQMDRWAIAYGVLGFGMVSCVLVLGTSMGGATNWISIGGFSLQPSELAKIVFVFFVASMLKEDTSFKRVVITTAVAAAFVLVLVLETDLGAAIIFFMTYLLMLFVATKSKLYLALGMGSACGASVIGYFAFSHVKVRVQAWKDPWSDYANKGYQICQSLMAIGTGGWFGMGLFRGSPDTIPVVVSDFVFSAISEEMGALFAICLLLVYLSCFIMFINISLQLTIPFYKLLAVGLSVSYGFQVFLCVGGVTKFIPHTGVTLPLISYGGSSVLSTIIIFAVIQGLYLLRQKEVRRFAREREATEGGIQQKNSKRQFR